MDYTYEFGDKYKTPRELVGLLVNIVAKGGNLALNVSPQPDGRIPVEAVKNLKDFGSWMKTYGDAIYRTRVCPPYRTGDVYFTQKGETVYVIRLYPDANDRVEEELYIPYSDFSSAPQLKTGAQVPFVKQGGGALLTINERQDGEAPIALVFELKK